MEEITIREGTSEDIPLLAELWLQTSVNAHNFIAADYWIANKNVMENKYLPHSEVYVAIKMGTIYGFVALVDNYLASLFVENQQQGQGVGSLLLNHVQKIRKDLLVSVYQKNENSIQFYSRKGFKILAETVDEATGERELTMQWKS